MDELVHRKNAHGTQHRHVVGGETDVLIRIRSGLGGKIQVVFVVCQRREFLYQHVPFGHTLHAGTFAPLLSHAHGIMPVRKLERRIYRIGGTQGFLGRNGALQDIAVVRLVVGSERVHKLGGFLYQLVIFPDNRVRRLGTVKQFGKVNQVGLLPDEEASHVRRCLDAARVGHLHPAHAFESLTFGNLAGYGFRLFIPAQGASHHFGVSPQGEMRLMPPNHFQMELSEPRVIRQARFLRRRRACALDSHQVLAQHHAAFQFLGARIGAKREVHRPAFRPIRVPIRRCSLFRLGKRHGRRVRRLGRKLAGKGKSRVCRSQDEIVLFFLLQGSIAFPTHRHIIGRGVQLAFQHGALPVLFHHRSRMLVVRFPVARIVAMLARRVRETELDARRSSGRHPCGYHVAFRMANGLYPVRGSVQRKAAGDFSVPHIQRLTDILHLVGRNRLVQLQAHNAQMQAVRIDAKPVGSVFLTAFFLELARIHLLVPAPEIVFLLGVFGLVVARIGKAVPAPLALCAQRHSVLIHFGESLKPGRVYGIGKLAVPHRERR